MTRAAAPPASSPTSAQLGEYFQRAELPLSGLVFLLPLIVVYEWGARKYTPDIIAFEMMQRFFHLFGAHGRWLPALAVVGILLAWHIARKDPWKVYLSTIAGMVVESVTLGIPLLLLGVACRHYLPLSAGGGDWRSWTSSSFGAGIYEELVFRLIALTLLSLLMVDLLRTPKAAAIPLMVMISAVLFAAYHYLGAERFSWQSFAFRTAAGVYFAVLFLTRGYGITAGAHASYDIIIKILAAWAVH